MLLLNLVLAIVWMVLQSSFTLVDLGVGFGLGFVIIGLTQRGITTVTRAEGDERPARLSYIQYTLKIASFIGFALWEIVKANLAVARIVISPRPRLRPGIVAIPLDVRSDAGVTLLANLVTLTPGTVTLDISTDRRTMYIHALDVQDADALRDEIKRTFERRVMELLP